MAEKINQSETVSFEELLLSNTYTQEALVNLMIKKGLIKKEELLEEIRLLQKAISSKAD